jgi:DNA-binding NtrC family response regulator
VWQARSVAEATKLMDQQPDLMIVDVRLPDGDAFSLVELAARAKPSPVVVAVSGEASPEEAFRLGQLGVRAYVAKPFSVESLSAEVEAALRAAPKLEPWVAACVGQTSMRDLQSEVRRVMIDQAIALAEGNRSGAARLLHVSRQAVQQVMRDRSDHSDDDDQDLLAS